MLDLNIACAGKIIKRRLEACGQAIASLLKGQTLPPRAAAIDPVNICNLRCPLCPTGLGKLDFDPTVMTLDAFKMIIDKIPSLRITMLYNWGEPFLNPSIFDMVRYAASLGIYTQIDSNFSLEKEQGFFENIVTSGLSELRVSLDGASQEIYSRYRRNGEFARVLSNVQRVNAAKKRLNKKTPRLVWRFIVNKFNEGEIAAAQRRAKDLKMKFQKILIGTGEDCIDFKREVSTEQCRQEWLPSPAMRQTLEKTLMGGTKSKKYCPFLFRLPIINPDATVSPCCFVASKTNTFGDLKQKSFLEVWHNARYRASRSLFKKTDRPAGITTICFDCDNYRRDSSRIACAKSGSL